MDSIREVQAHISAALSDWSYIMNDIDANEKTHLLHYSEKDLFNILYMFEHVMINVGIHNGVINEDNATAMGSELREYVKKCTNIDTIELANKVLKNS